MQPARRAPTPFRLFLPLCALALGCGESLAPDPTTLLDDPLADFPPTMSEVGLYPAAPDRSSVADRAVAYDPSWDLWSNGLSKERFVVLPDGGSVDIADRERWSFPAGTLFFKTFSEPGQGLGRAIETRVIRRTSGDWDYAVYQWNDAGTDAERLSLDEPVPAAVTVDGATFDHLIPTKLECRQCHESNTSIVIGFDELRLADAIAGHAATQLEELAEQGVLAGSLPAKVDTIEGDDVVRQVKGYLHGNCAHCHNAGEGPENAFDLRHPVMLANTIGQPTEGNASADGIRVVPGQPEGSVLFQAFSGETDDPEVKPMPPAGVQRRDAAAVEMLRTWILSLPSDQ